MLTSTIKIEGAFYDRLPVITSSDIPKSKLFDVMKEINNSTVKAPVKAKDVLIKDVCGLGVDIIASRSMQAVDNK
jgi:CxxC motif-containing protein